MEDLTNGINQARLQCHNQCRKGTPNTSIRRARSSASPRMNQRKMSQTDPTSPTIMVSPKEAEKPALTSPTLSSPEPQHVSPEPIELRQRSISVSDSAYSSSSSYMSFGSFGRNVTNSTRIRTLSLTAPNVSLSQGSESIGSDWLSSSTIPELPESPTMSITSSPILKVKNNSTPTLNYSSSTAPRPSKRSYSTSTSLSFNHEGSKPKLRDYQPFQSLSSHRNSLPEAVMNKIMEDEVDTGNVGSSLSQASLSQISTADEGSPRSQGSTLIMRRSSLTGQVEHIRRPRYRLKNNSFHASQRSRSKSNSFNSLNTTGQEYKVLNTGFRHNRKSRIILPNSIETTV